MVKQHVYTPPEPGITRFAPEPGGKRYFYKRHNMFKVHLPPPAMTRHIRTSRPPTQNTPLRLPARFRARLLQRAQRHLPSEAGTARAVLVPRGVTAAHAAVEGRAVRGPSFARSVMPVGVRVRVRLGLGLGLGSGLRLGLEG